MSGMVHKVAAAADIITPSNEHHMLMLRHHLNEAFLFSEELGLKMAASDLCRLLRLLED